MQTFPICLHSRRIQAFYQGIGEKIEVFEETQKAQINENGDNNHAFALGIGCRIFNQNAKRIVQNRRKSDNSEESPVPPTIKKVARGEAEVHTGATFQ